MKVKYADYLQFVLTTMRIPKLSLQAIILLVSCVVGCNTIGRIPIALTATPIPTLTPSPALTVSPTSESIPDSDWTFLQPGLERRLIHLYNDQGQQVESLYIYRLNQNQFRLDIAYHEKPQSLEDWRRETNALMVVNGGYFRIENDKYIPNGLTIINGETFGSSYGPFAGMLAIREFGAELRWLANKPYSPNEFLLAGLQSFPLLVKPGGTLGFPKEYEDNLQARRTVIGQDKKGRILFLVASQGYFTLHQLSAHLTESDLDLDIAINLDGGPSSGILVANPRETIPAQSLLPLVILVYVR